MKHFLPYILSLFEWFFTICPTPSNRQYNLFSALLNKTFPSFRFYEVIVVRLCSDPFSHTWVFNLLVYVVTNVLNTVLLTVVALVIKGQPFQCYTNNCRSVIHNSEMLNTGGFKNCIQQ